MKLNFSKIDNRESWAFNVYRKFLYCINYLVGSNSILDYNIIDTRMRQASLCHRLENGLYRKWHHLERNLTWTAVIIVRGLSVSSGVRNSLYKYKSFFNIKQAVCTSLYKYKSLIKIKHAVSRVYTSTINNVKLISSKLIYLYHFVSWDTSDLP